MGRIVAAAFEAQLEGEFFTLDEARRWVERFQALPGEPPAQDRIRALLILARALPPTERPRALQFQQQAQELLASQRFGAKGEELKRAAQSLEAPLPF